MTGPLPPSDAPPLPEAAAPRAGAALRIALRLASVALAVWGVHALMGWLSARTTTDALAAAPLPLTAAIVAAYALLIAVPFVPGIEIALVLLMVDGARIAPFLYLATVAGLALAYLAGRALPHAGLARAAADLRMRRLAAWIDHLAPLPPEARLALLTARLPARLGRLVGRHHYLILGLLLNLPGSSFIGGGGGICLVAGLSRLYLPALTLLTIAVAVAPVPLVIWLFDAPGLVTL